MPYRKTALRGFGEGALAISPICVAAMPIGLLLGALAAERGLSVLESGLMSATVFAGASQFVAVGLWADPLPSFAIVFATFLVNLRHLIMSASLGRSMGLFSGPQRLAAFFTMADEVWALAETRAAKGPLTPAFYAGLAAPLYVTWCLSTMTGAAFGRMIGDPAAYGLDFVFSALFIGLIVGFRTLPAWLPAVLASAAASVLTYQFLPSPWFVIAGGLAGVGAAALLAGGGSERMKEAECPS